MITQLLCVSREAAGGVTVSNGMVHRKAGECCRLTTRATSRAGLSGRERLALAGTSPFVDGAGKAQVYVCCGRSTRSGLGADLFGPDLHDAGRILPAGGGTGRAKNSVNVAIKHLMGFCVSSLLFWAVGFGLMFGSSVGGWIGVSGFSPGAESGPKLLAFLLFQAMLCSMATTIVSGAVAERMRFGSYLVLCAVLSCLVYPWLGHWVWNDGPQPGWLRQLGFVDFAGSTVVHSLGAWFALATLLAIGPRRGRFDAGASQIRPHNLLLATLGVFLLWFGWFGFNGGRSLAPDGVAAHAILNTILAGAAGGITGGLTTWKFAGRPRIEPMLSGVLGGLVGVTAGCHVFAPWAAAAVGGTAGVIVYFGDAWLTRRRIDDAVSAVPVHGFAGVWGTLAVALFASPTALGFAGRSVWHQLGVQGAGSAGLRRIRLRGRLADLSCGESLDDFEGRAGR